MAESIGMSSAGSPPSGARPTLERAEIDVRKPPANGSAGTDAGPEGGGPIKFQFNPKSLTMTKAADWKTESTRKGKAPTSQFIGAKPASLSLEMFLDATEKMDNSVVKSVERLFNCCVPTKESEEKKAGSPPMVIFRWGATTTFTGYITEVSANYTLFTPGGTPVRAVCTVKIQEMAGVKGSTNPTSGGLSARNVHVVIEGDTLASVAYRHYGVAAFWRRLAEVNEVDDPMRLAAGTRLLVPAIDELTNGDGRG